MERAALAADIPTLLTSSSSGRVGTLDLRLPQVTDQLARIIQNFDVSHCVFAAGMSGFSLCHDQPEKTRMVNVDGALRVADVLDDLRIPAVFISTSAIFGHTASSSTEGSPPHPMSEYGRQISCRDEKLLAGSTARILRLTKVLSSSDIRWSDWMYALQHHDPVIAPENLAFAPLLESWVGKACLNMLGLPQASVRHASPPTDVTYVEAARTLASVLQVPQRLILGRRFESNFELGQFGDVGATLATEHPEFVLGVPNAMATLQRFFKQMIEEETADANGFAP